LPNARLPYGKQFSPEQVELGSALVLAKSHEGDRSAFQEALRTTFFHRDSTTLSNGRTLAMNAFLSIRQYGLIVGGSSTEDPFRLTEVGQSLHDLAGSPAALLEAFAEHILSALNGLQLLEVVESLRARGVTVTVGRVADELLAIGIDPGARSGENINPLRMWLEKAGILRRWQVEEESLRRLAGTGMADITELASLPLRHRAYLLALSTMTDAPPYNAADVRRLAELQTVGAEYETKGFAKDVLDRLAAEGWLGVTKTTAGRGAKSHEVTPTERLEHGIREPLLAALVEQSHLQDPIALRRPIRELLEDVQDGSLTNHARGLALEGVCIQLVRLLGARFVDWRRRGDDTSGAEVDVVAELLDGRYQLLQIQSKASRISGRETIDREVGVAAALKSNVLLLVTAQDVADSARGAAALHMQESGLAILFLEGADLARLETGAEISGAIDREWRRVAAIRSPRTRQRVSSLR
jgi:hypothetical protein